MHRRGKQLTHVVRHLLVPEYLLPRLRLTKLSVRVVLRVLAVLARNVGDVVPVRTVALAVLLSGVAEDLSGCCETTRRKSGGEQERGRKDDEPKGP